jgi:transposase
MDRHSISNEKYERIRHLFPAEEGKVGRRPKNTRRYVNAVLYILATGCPWRDLPAEFGPWNSVFKRFSNWCRLGVWDSIMKALNEQPDEEVAMLDSTIMRAHQHAAGAKKRGFHAKRAERSKVWGVPVAV